METEYDRIETVLLKRGFSDLERLDGGTDSNIYTARLQAREVLLKVYNRLSEINPDLEDTSPASVLKWYFQLGTQARAELKKNPNPLNQTLIIDNQAFKLEYRCADFGLLIRDEHWLTSIVRKPIKDNPLKGSVSTEKMQDYWSEIPSSQIEKQLEDMIESTLFELLSSIQAPAQRFYSLNAKVKFFKEEQKIVVTFTDLYGRIVEAFNRSF